MKRMHALEKAAMVTGFLSLVGLCAILYTTVFSSSTSITAARSVSDSPATNINNFSPTVTPKTEAIPAIEQSPEMGANDGRPQVTPSIQTMRKAVKAIPFITTLKQTISALPALRKVALKQRDSMEKLRREQWKQLESEKENSFIETEPPVEQPQQKTREVEIAKPPKKEEPAPKVAGISSLKTKPKPLTAEAEKAILEEANRATATEVNKKLLMRASGKIQVREMRKRPDGTLTDQQLEGVFNNIVTAKGEQDSDASCVHIQSLPGTEKTAAQIGTYLRRKGFVMAGRGEAPQNARGIHVDASGKCVTIVVGI